MDSWFVTQTQLGALRLTMVLKSYWSHPWVPNWHLREGGSIFTSLLAGDEVGREGLVAWWMSAVSCLFEKALEVFGFVRRVETQ